jgi:hypothetical protein
MSSGTESYMKTFTLDYETYYDKTYSLRLMTPAEYILDPRFECIGCAVDNQKGVKVWMEPDQLSAFFAKLGDEPVCFVSHNALFDMPLTAWRFGYVPALMVDTMGLSRAWLSPFVKRHSLEHIAQHLGIGLKGKTVHKVSGMNRAAMKMAGLYEEYTEYSLNDAELTTGIFKTILGQGFPLKELLIMDMVLRMAVEPKFSIDPYALHEHYAEVLAAKQTLLDRVGMTVKELRSDDQFALALTRLGIEPPPRPAPPPG